MIRLFLYYLFLLLVFFCFFLVCSSFLALNRKKKKTPLLLKQNSHIIQFYSLKCTTWWLNIFKELCIHHHNQLGNTFINPKRNLIPSLSNTPIPRKPLILCLDLSILMLLNCGVRENSWESLELQGDPTSQILNEISPEYLLEGLMLKLKLQYFGHLMQRTDSLEKILMLGMIEGGRRRGWQRMRWFDDITDLTDMSLSKFWVLVMDREAWHVAIHGVTKSWTWLIYWTEWKTSFQNT